MFYQMGRFRIPISLSAFSSALRSTCAFTQYLLTTHHSFVWSRDRIECVDEFGALLFMSCLKVSGLIKRFSPLCNNTLQSIVGLLLIQSRKYSLLNAGIFKMSSRQQDKGSFSLNQYDVIGFDLDHTICKYKIETLNKLIYQNIVNYLVNVKEYSADLFSETDGYEKANDFFLKGLILDFEKGNLLKLSSDFLILKAFHGTRPMEKSEIQQVYGEDCVFQKGKSILSTELCSFLAQKHNLYIARDYFAIGAPYICGRIIDGIDKLGGGDVDYKFWPDIYDSLVNMFTREAFVNGTGGYFGPIVEDPSKYIEKWDPQMLKWLKSLKKNKKTFLLTNSNADMAEFLLESCIGKDWREYFDFVGAYARKPGFYTGFRPFLELKGFVEGDAVSTNQLNGNETFSQGNWADMTLYFANSLQKEQPRMLYFGDSLIDDVYGPANFTRCHTVAIVEEMSTESEVSQHSAKDIINSKIWGSFFSGNVEGKEELTFFASLITKHSVLSIPDIKTLSSVDLQEQIKSFNGSNEGFYPSIPRSLKNVCLNLVGK